MTEVNVGSTPNDGTGDPLRNAFIKVNSAITALKEAVGAIEQVPDAMALVAAVEAAEAAQSATAANAVQTGLDRQASELAATSASTIAAQLAAAFEGSAPIVAALTSPVPADGTVELLRLDAGLQVHEVVTGAWVLRGWLVGPNFDTVALLLASTATTLGATGQIVEAGGFRYEVAASGASDHHVTTAGGVKLYQVQATENPATAATQRVMQALARGESANVVFYGDSTGDATNEWIYLLAAKIGQQWPSHSVTYRTWDAAGSTYNAPVTIQTGTGDGVVAVYNCSIAGSVATRFAGDDLEASLPVEPDLVVLSYGHNGGASIDRHITMHATIGGEVSRLYPYTPIMVVGQNPVTTDETMAAKVRVLRALASITGWGWLDVHQWFKSLPSPLATYYADTVHPNALGSEVWADCALGAFSPSLHGAGGVGLSPVNRGVILTADSYAALLNNFIPAGMTVALETSDFETRGSALKLTGDGVTVSPQAYWTIIPPSEIAAYRGRYVTVSMRVKIADGVNPVCGRLDLFDGTTTASTAGPGPLGNDWFTQSITLRVGSAATYLRAYIYLNIGSATSDVITIDRLTVADGPIVRDSLAPRRIDGLEGGSIIGASNASLLTIRNSTSSGAVGIQVLDTTSGTDADNPATQYVVAVSARGVGGKRRSDAHDGVRLDPQNRGVFFGNGTAAPAFGLSAGNATDLLRVLFAHFYNETDNTYDLGLINRRWRRVYGREIRPGDALVIWTSGAGSPEGTVTAPVGSLYTRTDGGAGTTLYVKESGAGATGWVAK